MAENKKIVLNSCATCPYFEMRIVNYTKPWEDMTPFCRHQALNVLFKELPVGAENAYSGTPIPDWCPLPDDDKEM